MSDDQTSAAASRIRLRHASGSTAEIHPQGAHATSWVPAGGGEALFLSRAARFEPGTSIRGGIPVIFPQFADTGPLPKHGFARTARWQVVDGPRDEAAAASVRLRLADSDATREIWPHAFLAEVTVEIAGQAFRCALSVRNTGDAPFSFTAALHTYLRVADVRRASVRGLRGLTYRDKLRGAKEFVEEDAELRIADELDRVYLDAPSALRVRDEAGGRTILVSAESFADAVVWNPGARGAADFPDMEAGEEREMLCVEAAHAVTPVQLAPGETWRGAQLLSIE